MKSSLILLLAAGATAVWLTSCGDFQRGEPLPPTESPTPTDGNGGALSFATDVYPILLEYCESCHNSSGDASNSDFLLSGDAETDYETVLTLIDTENPTASRLLAKARGTGHTGGAVLASSSAEFNTIYDWIAEGAAP